jgi:hypothetical protein
MGHKLLLSLVSEVFKKQFFGKLAIVSKVSFHWDVFRTNSSLKPF